MKNNKRKLYSMCVGSMFLIFFLIFVSVVGSATQLKEAPLTTVNTKITTSGLANFPAIWGTTSVAVTTRKVDGTKN